MEEKIEYYYVLGRILHKYYNGEILTVEELEVMASATKDDCMHALDFNATERLSKRNDRSLQNLLKNQNNLKLVNLQEKSSKKSL